MHVDAQSINRQIPVLYFLGITQERHRVPHPYIEDVGALGFLLEVFPVQECGVGSEDYLIDGILNLVAIGEVEVDEDRGNEVP